MSGNLPLQSLDPASTALLASRMTPVSLERGRVLATRARPLRQVYFPTSAVLSLTTKVGRQPVHVLSIGSEGVAGYWLGLAPSVDLSVEVRCEIAGEALQLPAHHLQEAIIARPAIGGLMAEVGLSTTAQLIRDVACLKKHPLPARCARLLLELQMRLGEAFDVTHDSMARLLAVGRPSITRVIHPLAEDGVVEYTRGRVRVLDVAALRRRSGGCEVVLAARREALMTRRRGAT